MGKEYTSGFSKNLEEPVEKIEHLDIIHTADLPSNLADDIAYGPSGLRGLTGSPYVLGAAFLASMGGFSFGYDQGVISIVNVMDQFHAAFPRTEQAFWKGFMTGMLEFGAFIGCFFMPALADKISRKRALIVVVVIFNIGAIMQTAAQSYGVLVAGRTIGGIGVGTLAMVRLPILLKARLKPNHKNARAHPFTSPKSRRQTSEARCWSWNPSQSSGAS